MNRQRLTAVAAIAIGSLFATDTFAVPYASGLRNTTGTTYEFILNEAASDVTIDRDGASSLNLGALAAGRHTFDLGASASYDLNVSGNTAAGYNAVDDSANNFTHFERPGGLAINTVPTSPYFGTVYVNQGRSFNGFTPIVTGSGRPMGNGIYSLTADRAPVNLTDFTIPSDANDTSLAKAPGIDIDTGNSNSLYRIALDDAGNIIGSDWSDAKGGLKYISADLTSGGQLLREALGPSGGVLSDDSDEFGFIPLHGSVNGEPQVSGTLGVDLVVSAMDEDLDIDLEIPADDGNSVWTWNIGATTDNYAGAPKLEIAVGDLHTSTGQDRHTSGVQGLLINDDVGTHSDGSQLFLSWQGGVTANAQYNAQHNKWYLSGSRSNGNDSSSLVILTPEGAGGDGRDIQVDWASKQFSIDNELDGFTDQPDVEGEPNYSVGFNDIFRQAHNVTFSPDGTIMFLERRTLYSNVDNPYLGIDSGLGANILAIPLDANGLPDIQIDDNGTPGDTTDDFITNITPIFTGGGGSYSQVKTDAAGNVYFSSNSSELLEYYSLGGNTVATTSGGTGGTTAFSVSEVAALLGDYNGNGVVDAADYTVYRDTLGDTVTPGEGADGDGDGNITMADYTVWVDNFGNSASTAVAVPEPTSLLLLAAGLMGLAGRRSRS